MTIAVSAPDRVLLDVYDDDIVRFNKGEVAKGEYAALLESRRVEAAWEYKSFMKVRRKRFRIPTTVKCFIYEYRVREAN